MSRWSPYRKMNLKKENAIWINKPKRHYIITTKQGTIEIDRFFLDYRKTIENMKKAGYTDIKISCIGYNVTF